MTEKALSPDELVLHRLVIQNRSLEDLIGELNQFSPEQRALAKKTLWSLRGKEDLSYEHRYVVVAAFLDDMTPSQVTAIIGKWTIQRLVRDGPVLNHLVERFTARGETWVRGFVTAVLNKRGLPEFAVPLLDPLIRTFGLPLPDEHRYWLGWMRDHSTPTPGCRWEEYFVAACSVPGAFAVPCDDKVAYLDRVVRHIRVLRTTEPTDDPALLRALLQIFGRGDGTSSQRVAMVWLEGLGLIHLMQDARAQVTAALPTAEAFFVKLAVEQLLAVDLTDDELTDMLLAILPRKMRRLKRFMLRVATRLETPSQELLDTVQLIAAGTDTASATLAENLLTRWGTTPDEEPDVLGLWRPPAGRDSRPLPDYTVKALVLDNFNLALLLAELDTDRRSNPDLQERALAALVATAHARGAAKVRHAIRICISSPHSGGSVLRQLLAKLGEQGDDALTRLGMPGSAPLTFLAMQRAVDALSRLGELPCLLSAPTHAGFHIAWGAFAARAHHYRKTRVKVLPTDVAVALARLDRSEIPEDLSGFIQPIRGITISLATALRYWKEHPGRSGSFRLLPAESREHHSSHYLSECLEVDGDEPTVHDLLKLRNGWTLPYKPIRAYAEDPWTSVLLPEHPTRPASLVIHTSVTRAPDILERIATTAPRVGPVGSFAFLELASRAGPKERERVAALILTAWDEERMTADDLVMAWNDPRRKTWELSGTRVAAILGLVAEAGGLAIAWPLLTAIVEELTGQEKVHSTTSAVLESVLRYVPDALAAGITIELPNVTALASREETCKSRTASIARRIVQALH